MYKNGKNITIIDHNVNCVDNILCDISKTHPLTNEEEHQQGNLRARARLIESNMRYVVSVAKLFLPSGAALEDLILAGCEGLTKAADKFDGSLGYRFISFATWHVKNEICKTAYDHMKHNHVSLDEPLDSEDERGATRLDNLADGYSQSPDWDIRYAEALDSMASRADKHLCGAGRLVTALHQMLQEGYTTSDFARRYNLNEHQMSHLFDLISQPPSSGPMVA